MILNLRPLKFYTPPTVAAFARKTGDYAVLSATDLRVLALTYQLEFEACGMTRIRTEPLRPNAKPVATKPVAKRTKHAAKEITGDFEDEVKEEEEGQAPQADTEQGNTVLEEESDDDEDEGAEDQDEVQEVAEKLENLSTAESSEATAASTTEESTENKEGEEENKDGEAKNEEDDDDDGEWITPENVKKYTRHGTLKPKKKVRKTLLMQVACTTSDYAMQNVLLQMGLNLLSIDGLRIGKVKNWVLRCHACTK